VEPSSQVLTHELRTVAGMALRDISYEIGPLLTLVDGSLFESWWEERRELLLGQVSGADLVAVSQADTLEPEQLSAVREALRRHGPDPLRLSVPEGWGVDEVLAAVVRVPMPGRRPEG
jgi:G3E family GTPase